MTEHESPASAVLDVHGLTVTYRRGGRDLAALSDLSFRIPVGGAYALVGESGSGKSTAALATMGHLPVGGRIAAGSVRLGDQELVGLNARRLRAVHGSRIAMVYQNPDGALNPALRIGTQITEVLRRHGDAHRESVGATRAKDLAVELLNQVSMPDPVALLERFPHQLSGGQQQRVVIAMALAGSPRLLVLDEPTTGLDATVQAEVLDLIGKLRSDTGTALLIISHDLGVVSRVADRVGVLYGGRLIEEGSTDEILTAPRHPYTAGLLACRPTMASNRRTARLLAIPGQPPALHEVTQGCAFAPRCAHVQQICIEQRPEPIVDGGRATSCHFPLAADAKSPADELPRPSRPSPAVNPAPLVLDLREVRKSFGAHPAVDGVSLQLRRGETYGLVGESGSGKTTLGRIAVGLSSADSGTVGYLGTPLADRVERRAADARRAIQMVFQRPDSTLNPRRAVRKALARAAFRLRGELSADELAQRVRLGAEQLDAYPSQLSGGMKQRAAIARAFAGRPAVVVCDEPTSALDVSVQAAVLNLLADLSEREGTAYLFISHDLAAVRYLADRIGVLYRGRLVEEGSADEVLRPPYHPYTELLVAAAAGTRVELAIATTTSAADSGGCRFADRCPRSLGKLCRTTEPPVRTAAPGHVLSCHLSLDELAQEQKALTR
jgi:peptide/nickel transport system ATP-binding protein